MILQPIRIQSGRTHLVSQPRVCRRHPSRLCLALAERPASEAAVAQALAGPHPALAEAPRGQIQGWDRATFHATNRRGKQGQRVLRLKRPVLRRRRQRQRRDRRQRRRVGVGGWKAAVGGAGPLYHLELERFEHSLRLQPSHESVIRCAKVGRDLAVGEVSDRDGAASPMRSGKGPEATQAAAS